MSLRRRWDEFLNPRPSRRPGPFYWFLAVLLVVLGVYVAGALLEGSRRTAQAPIEILASSPQQTVGRSGPQPGWRVQYAFEAADGQTYVSEAFRTGSLDEIGAGHACYEPTNPGNNELVRPTVRCPQ